MRVIVHIHPDKSETMRGDDMDYEEHLWMDELSKELLNGRDTASCPVLPDMVRNVMKELYETQS